MSVKVGVRVRPFNQRQKDLDCRLCIDMIGATTRLFDADDPEKHRDFTFDYSFWSHDGFTPNQNGYFVPDTDKYADQQQVFKKVGLEILSNAWEGYHCCLFAYGQTGSGKSYSMVGYGANKGIVPISCEQIFNRIHSNEDKQKQYEVNVSMLQIYNEKVQDLLIPISKRQKQGYKIRQHKTLGIYVQGLSKHYVDTYEAIERKMDEGSKNRSIAATEMNASSSRAHTIISIQFRQKQMFQGKKRQKLSVIHLVDLAGSQKVGKTGATGDRLKEAAGINKSLSVLGLVISTLADKAMGKGKGIIVPYRDSCLTRILQNALGGNSKTLMICAISPATDNYDETLSTLRYADQAKKIQNKAVVNESETDKIIRNLTSQKNQLSEKVAKFQEMFKRISQGLGIQPEKLNEFNDAKEQLRFNAEMMNDYAMTKSQKLLNQETHSSHVTELTNIDKNKPHLSNLNQDPQLSRIINYSIDKQLTKIGRRNVEPANDIQIGGIAIRQLHAIIQNDGQVITIMPKEAQEDTNCYLNGNMIIEKTEIKNLDRLTFGNNNMFIVMIPGTQPRSQIDQSSLDWQMAQNELYLKKQELEKEQIEEREERQRKIKEEAEKILRQKEEQLAELQKKLKENEETKASLIHKKEKEMAEMERKLREEEAERLKREIQKKKKKMQADEDNKHSRVKEKYLFEKKMLKVLPICNEINLIAKEFRRNITMVVKMLMSNQDPDDDDEEEQILTTKRFIKIKVFNKQLGYIYWWSTEKLTNRYYIIKDMSEQYFETGVIPELQEKDDPFWDPSEPALIGRSFIPTKSLTYLFDESQALQIVGEDTSCGELCIDLIPTDASGKLNLCEQLDEEEEFQPVDTLNKPFYFKVVIKEAKIPENYTNIFVAYSVKVNQYTSEKFKTNTVEERTQVPVFEYSHVHSYANMSESLLEYLQNEKIIFKVFGNQFLPKQGRKSIKNRKGSNDLKSVSSIPTQFSEEGIQEKIEEAIKVDDVTQKEKEKKPNKKQKPKKTKNKKQSSSKKSEEQPEPLNNETIASKQKGKKGKNGKEECRIF